jgi:hypothetical protein
MALVHDLDGKQSMEVPLSFKQRELLDAGQEVTISFHTPQLMRGLLGSRSGKVTIRRQGDQVIASNTRDFHAFKMLREAIETVQKQREPKA